MPIRQGTQALITRQCGENTPERLNLDRRDLSQMPLLEGEERLKLLNFQYNAISKIENLEALEHLRDLNLSENNIKKIENLNAMATCLTYHECVIVIYLHIPPKTG